jgi:hypothetical protein
VSTSGRPGDLQGIGPHLWIGHAPTVLAQPSGAAEVVTEVDLAGPPPPVAAYVRRAGAVGKPRVTNVYADVHGRIRGGADKAWMTWWCWRPRR